MSHTPHGCATGRSKRPPRLAQPEAAPELDVLQRPKHKAVDAARELVRMCSRRDATLKEVAATARTAHVAIAHLSTVANAAEQAQRRSR